MSIQIDEGCINERCWAKNKCLRWLFRDNAKKTYPFDMDGVFCVKAKWIEKDDTERVHEEQ
jgi:hypothetical protein